METPPVTMRSLLAPHRFALAFVIALEALQQLVWIVEPFVFGRAMDALIVHQQHEQLPRVIFHLGIWIGVFASNTVAGVVWRAYAERVHGRLYRGICVALMKLGLEEGQPAHRIAARAVLFREIVTFFEQRVPAVVASVINVSGAVIALVFFDWRIAGACLFLGLPLLVVQRVVDKRVASLQRDEHDLRERDVEVFASADPEQVAAHFDRVTKVRSAAAGWGALNFGGLRVVLLGIFVVVLWVAVDIDGFTTGAIYSIVSYLWTFSSHAEDMPVVLTSRAALRDLGDRLESGNHAEASA